VKFLKDYNNKFSPLVDFVASVIFTASAQHAAVNFTQAIFDTSFF
jgi:hypothetical protein